MERNISEGMVIDFINITKVSKKQKFIGRFHFQES